MINNDWQALGVGLLDTREIARIVTCNVYAMSPQRIRGYFYNEMCYINLRFTYLLTYLLT